MKAAAENTAVGLRSSSFVSPAWKSLTFPRVTGQVKIFAIVADIPRNERAWQQTRKRQLLYRYLCLVRLLGWEDEGQRSFVHGQMAPCLLKEEQRKNGDKRWSHREHCFPFRKRGPFMPARLCASTAEETLLAERGHGPSGTVGTGQSYTQPTKPPCTQLHNAILN